KERYSFADIAFLVLATVCLVGIGASLLLGSEEVDSNADRTLVGLANAIERNFASETAAVLDPADAIQLHEKALAANLKECRAVLDLSESDPDRKRCGLWEALSSLKTLIASDDASSPDLHADALGRIVPGSLELDIATWLDRDGEQ